MDPVFQGAEENGRGEGWRVFQVVVGGCVKRGAAPGTCIKSPLSFVVLSCHPFRSVSSLSHPSVHVLATIPQARGLKADSSKDPASTAGWHEGRQHPHPRRAVPHLPARKSSLSRAGGTPATTENDRECKAELRASEPRQAAKPVDETTIIPNTQQLPRCSLVFIARIASPSVRRAARKPQDLLFADHSL